ncbi:MAG: winged helix DNA-binding domain-containing protein [Micromonosporaceae bacterium]
MTAIRRIDVEQRRARLALRHHLAPSARAKTAAEVAGNLVGLHGTDPASVFLAVQARVHGGPAPEAIADEMYTQRALMRMLGMRRTMFVVATGFAPVMQAACTDEIARRQRRRYADLLAQGGIPDADAWLKDVEESTALALASRGEATAAELAADEPRLRQQVMLAEGKSYGGMQGVGTWVLSLLAADGRIVRGRPRGSWTSSQFRWLPIEEWLPGGLERPPESAARAEVLRRWLAVSGPATADDLRWWTGWSAGQVKAAAAAAGVAEVDLGGSTGLVLTGDEEPVSAPAPWAALLPALDPTVMGWRAREWFLGAHGAALTDRSGNIGPTVWWDGRVVGGWAQRPDGEIVYRLLEDVGTEAAGAVEEEAKRLRGWIPPARVTPRFRTPLERELSA